MFKPAGLFVFGFIGLLLWYFAAWKCAIFTTMVIFWLKPASPVDHGEMKGLPNDLKAQLLDPKRKAMYAFAKMNFFSPFSLSD